MHYFSIHTQNGTHLGFLIMLPDDEQAAQTQGGRFAVKLQSENPQIDSAAAQALSALESADTPLYWTVEKDGVTLSNGESAIGRIRNEYLSLGGQTLVLNDLTGTL